MCGRLGGMPIDPATMSVNLPGEVISTDRPCIRCKYNLRGLEVGGACPECGTAISSGKKTVRFADNLVEAPIGYIKLIAVGLGLQAAMVVVFGFLLLFRGLGPIALLMLMGAAVGWAGGAWIVTVRRPKTERIVPDAILDSDTLRLVTRVSQGVCVLAALALWGLASTGHWAFAWLSGLLMVASMFGLIPMGIYLSSMADWAGDTGVGSRLRAGTWCVAVCGTFVVLGMLLLQIGFSFRLLVLWPTIIMGLFLLGGLALLGVSVLQLSIAAAWAIHNAREAQEREIRMAEKRRRRAMRDAARAHAAADALAATAPPPPESYADDPSVIPFDDGAGREIETRIDAVRSGGRPGSSVPVDSVRDRLSDPDDDSQAYELAPED